MRPYRPSTTNILEPSASSVNSALVLHGQIPDNLVYMLIARAQQSIVAG